MTLSVLILLAVTAQRLSELALARRNTARLLKGGGKEVGANHYPFMVLLHACWLAGLWWLVRNASVQLWPLAGYAVLQVFRVWILASIGSRWTTRIIVVDGERLVARGPYRFMRHPNYALVALEVPLLPLVFGLGWFAVVFGVLNLAMLAWRISVEERALSEFR